MNFAKDFLAAFFIGFGLGLPIYLPWLLARIGIYKRWYLVVFMPPLAYKNAIYLWPLSFMFLSFPIAVFFQGTVMVELIIGASAIIGIFTALYMITFPPRWAKARWQLYLEDNHNQQEIRDVFIPAWRILNLREWSKKMDSIEGIEEMVAYARQRKG